MSSETWKLETALCRCCHSEGLFKNLAEPCVNLGQEEIYSDMLRDCFDIEVLPVPGMLCLVTYMICDSCITRLRDAYNFKKQVVACETRFWDMYNRNVLTVSDNNVKLKVKIELDLDSDQDGGKPKAVAKAPQNDGTRQSGLLFQYLTKDRDYKEDLSTGDNEVFSDSYSTKYDEGDSEDTQETVKKKQKKDKTVKKKSTAKESKKEKIKAEKQEIEEIPAKKKDRRAAPQFRLRDDDYKKEGATYFCTRCEKNYDKLFSLRYHIKTKHYKIPKFTCPHCGMQFMTEAPLTVHKLKEHNIDDRFKCNACKGHFNTKVQLRKHRNNFHMLGEKSKCEFCDYESFSFESMYKHKFKHKTVKDYHCRFCKKAFLRKTTLDLHERIHTGDRRKVCGVCGQAFVQKASLNYHMTKYHPGVNF